MRKALESLPGVEKGSIKADVSKQLVTFKVDDPKGFKVEDAVKKVNEDTSFKASVAKTGSTTS